MGERSGPFRIPIVNQLLRGIPVRQVHAGAYHTHITTEDRRMFSYGWNSSGQCGVGSEELIIKVPTEVTVFRGLTITMVASGAMHSHFLDHLGNLWSVGNNAFGQLGLNRMDNVHRPTTVGLPSGITTRGFPLRLISCGDFFTIAIWGDSYAYSWGRNNLCQIGATRSNAVRKPERCWALNRRADEVTMIACGSDHTALLMKNGTVEQFGSNGAKQFGQFLNAERTPSLTKISMSGFTGARIIHITACGNATTGLDNEGNLYMWGSRHTLHRGSTEGLAEHPEVVWRAGDRESVRLIRMGRNHLHILTRSGLLYTWVFARLKESPSPFLTKTYYDYYQAKLESRAPQSSSVPVDGSGTIIVATNASPPNAPNSERDPYKLLDEMVPDAISEDMAQLENVALEEAWSDDVEFRVVETALDYLNHDASSSESESESSESESRSESDENEGDANVEPQVVDVDAAHQIAPQAARQRADPPPPAPPAQDGDENRVALPRKPWRSYFVGSSAVKDITCSAFTTQILMFGQFFHAEFRPLFLQPQNFFSDRELTLSDGTSAHVHKFWMHERCPALISKTTQKDLLPNADPFLLQIVLKYLYYDYTYLSDLSKEQLTSLRQLLKSLKLNQTSLANALASEIAFRKNVITTAELSQNQLEQSRRQYLLQLQQMYEKGRNLDFSLVATLSAPSTSTADDLESGTNLKLSGNVITVHKTILSIRVPFFDALFHSRFADSGTASYDLDCTIETLDHFLRYIYYGFTDFSIESALWILRNSEMLFVDKPRDKLVTACSSILRRSGRRKELKQVLALINPEFDPYEDGRDLPQFARPPSSDISTTTTTSPSSSSTRSPTPEAAAVKSRDPSMSGSFTVLDESPRPPAEVEMETIEIPAKRKPKARKTPKSGPNEKAPYNPEEAPVSDPSASMAINDMLDHHPAPPRTKKSKSTPVFEDS